MLTFVKSIVKKILRVDRQRSRRWFLDDDARFWRNTNIPGLDVKAHDEAWIGIQYHVIEKGLTMPNRRLAFGKSVIVNLIESTNDFLNKWKIMPCSVEHAIGVVKAYLELHEELGQDFSDDSAYWKSIREFIGRFPLVSVATQAHVRQANFYDVQKLSFPEFAHSRHSVRSYTDAVIPKETIVAAVELAMTAPSACNRQHVRVHCIANRTLAHTILEMQSGNRGFGHLADKVLIVTSDLSVEMGARERNDPFINGGIFLMNLCYSLHYYKIAHCILSCAIETWRQEKIRRMASIPEREVLIGMFSCGVAPDEFDVATSPRKPVGEIMSYME